MTIDKMKGKMKTKAFGLFALSILTLIFLMSAISAVTLAEWPLTTDASPTVVHENVSAGNFTNSSGISDLSFGVDGASASGWTTDTLNTSQYFQVTLEPKTGFDLNVNLLNFTEERTTNGILSYSVRWSKNDDFSSPETLFINNIGDNTQARTLEISTNIDVDDEETLYIRWFGYNAKNSLHNWTMRNIKLEGTVTQISAPSVSFCKNGAINTTDLTLNVEISNKGGGEDNDWLPLDTVEVGVELENDKNIDLQDVIFELGLFAEDSDKDIAEDMVWISSDEEKFEFGDIDEDDEGRHIFEFRVNPAETDSGNYLLKLKAYPKGDEDEICIDSSSDLGTSEFGTASEFYAEIGVSKETDRDKMVVVDDDDLPILEASCSQDVTLDVDVWNIGNRDFEDQFMVTLFNSDLGLDMKEVSLGDMDEGDDVEVSFTFTIPSDAEEKTYKLAMVTYYDYDEDDGKYETDYDRRSEDIFYAYVTVEGNCGAAADVTISASLESEAKAGKEMVIRATVTNNGDELKTLTINAAEFATWADLISQDQNTLILNAGQSRDVLFTFDVKKDASGSQTFFIEAVSDGDAITQPVSVNIEASRPFLGITGFAVENASLWGLGLLNIILIVIIVIVAVKIARRK